MIKKSAHFNLDNHLKIIDNVIQVSKFCSHNNFINEVLLGFSNYFLRRSNVSFAYYNDQNNTLEGILLANIRFNEHVHNKIKDLTPLDPLEQQFIEFRKRVSSGYAKMDVNPEAEIEFFSVLVKNQGVGSKLLNEFESFIKALKIKQYYLFTNEICDYVWYMNHGFELANSLLIDVSDLNLLFKDKKQFKLMIFRKKGYF